MLILTLALVFSFAAPAAAVEAAAEDRILTRGEFVAALFALNGAENAAPERNAFSDVPSGGALARAVGWASDNGIALGYGGGIRKSIGRGDITMNDILKVFPFGNSLCVVEVTGQQLLDALEWGAREVPGENGGFLQVSGLSFEIHSCIPSPLDGG